MKILSQNAASVLFEKVKSLNQQPHNSWRCIYFSYADKQKHKNPDLHTQFVVQALTDMLADADGYIYLCDDGDIFILFQGPMKPIMAKLSGHFMGLVPQSLSTVPTDSPFTIFDLSKYWQLFFNLCQAKSLQAVPA